jgi:hypothetical protein
MEQCSGALVAFPPAALEFIRVAMPDLWALTRSSLGTSL